MQDFQKNLAALLEALQYSPDNLPLKKHVAEMLLQDGQIEKARFINVSINDVLDMWIGSSEKNLHKLFELARRHTPSIIFIDELDAIGGSRQQMRSHPGRILTNQLLSEMDGVSSDNSEVLILGATNSPWFVDASLRRPGRFDRILFVPPPGKSSGASSNSKERGR